MNEMTPTRDYKQTIVEDIRREPEFARALPGEAATMFLNGEADAARRVVHMMRDVIVPSRNDAIAR
jgi:hypothetical protein